MGCMFAHTPLIWEQNSDQCTENWLEELNIRKRNYVRTGINLTIFQVLKMLNFSQFLRLSMSEFDSVFSAVSLRFTYLLCMGNSYNMNFRNAGSLHVNYMESTSKIAKNISIGQCSNSDIFRLMH
jgi:hypothetical protein